MNQQLVAKHLGMVAMLIGVSMAFSLLWTHPSLGGSTTFEWTAFESLLGAIAIALATGGLLLYLGRHATGNVFRREALAVAGLSWCLATVLGAVPYLLSDTCTGPGPAGDSQLRAGVPMTVIDALFESASGFTGTGATVITNLEDEKLVPRAILFWRSETHFLGGLGILVLFVAVLGQGASAKAVMRAEMPGPTKQSDHARIQQAARAFAAIYIGLNALLTVLLILEGMSAFDALCHSFGTIATGGFSTYNDSVGHFQSAAIETTIIVFMAVSCINFALLFAVVLRRAGVLLGDIEFRTYIAILLCASALAIAFGLYHADFAGLGDALRYGTFQVTSILTNTGFATHDSDQWNPFGRGLLFLLMFVGGCTGSTSCSIKVIRYLLLCKGLWRELERAYRPQVVRAVRINREPVDETILEQVFVYFGLVAFICAAAWLGLVLFEPTETWTRDGHSVQEKYVDCASGVAATINGVGPGLGTIGATRNYAHFHAGSKALLACLMLLGRLEMIPILVLLFPRFWKVV